MTAVDDEAALAARAAWLHFAGGKTQGEVAELLGVQSTKAHRLIARARNDGLIRVFVEGPIAGCIALEEQLSERYGLDHCEVVPNVDEGPMPLRTLGIAGARYIRNLIESGPHDLIGYWPRPHPRRRRRPDAERRLPTAAAFVSLLGGLTRRFAASPFDVIHQPGRAHRRRSLCDAGAVLRQHQEGQGRAAGAVRHIRRHRAWPARRASTSAASAKSTPRASSPPAA